MEHAAQYHHLKGKGFIIPLMVHLTRKLYSMFCGMLKRKSSKHTMAEQLNGTHSDKLLLWNEDPTGLVRQSNGFVSEEEQSYNELETVIKKLQNGKPPGSDLVKEMSKSGGGTIIMALHELS